MSSKNKPDETSVRQVRLFKNGGNQAVRIPREFELPGTAARMRREGSRLIIEPLAKSALTRLLDSWDNLDVTWPDFPDPPPEAVKLHR
jgi:antitoxin VapB